MKTSPEPTAVTAAEARAPGAVPLAVAALVSAPSGWIVVGFRAAEGSPVPALAWAVALAGLGAATASLIMAARARAADGIPHRSVGRATGLAVTALILAALGPAFWLLVQIAPPADDLEGALLGPAGFVIAILVGMISFFSPCILPLLPGYLSFVSGLSGEEIERGIARRRVIAGTGLFTLGFATVFTALGASASLIGGFLTDHLETAFRVGGVIVIVMGLAFMTPQLMRFLEVERRPLMNRARPGVGGAFPLGLAFAVGWTPCVGPGLGIMLTLGAVEGSAARGALLLFFFSLGFGIWFVLAALGLRRALGASSWLRRNIRALQLVGGVFLVALGVLFVTNTWFTVMAPLLRWINQFAPPV